MASVTVLILHGEPDPAAGPLTRALAAARLELADRHRTGFLAAGADEVRLITGPPDDTAFGTRLRSMIAGGRTASGGSGRGLVILGSGSIALATAADRRSLVAAAASGERRALTNNRFSADVVALGRADLLDGLPDLVADNALPRWLERSGVRVDVLRGGPRLALDLDSPLDLVLLARRRSRPAWLRAALAGLPTDRVSERLDGLARLSRDPAAELLVSGRTSAATLRWLERQTASRTRAFVEERGLRAAEPLRVPGTAPAPRPSRPPASLLGAQLDAVGPGRLGGVLATLADGAAVDLRVLLAHRLGADERGWPGPEDRFAADLLLAERIADPWLAELTRSALEAPIPVVLGGHTLVGPGLRLALAGDPTGPA